MHRCDACAGHRCSHQPCRRAAVACRGHCPTIECCRYITGAEWLTGSADGSVSLWSSSKKKPLFTMRCGACAAPGAAAATAAVTSPAGCVILGASAAPLRCCTPPACSTRC